MTNDTITDAHDDDAPDGLRGGAWPVADAGEKALEAACAAYVGDWEWLRPCVGDDDADIFCEFPCMCSYFDYMHAEDARDEVRGHMRRALHAAAQVSV